MFQSVLIAKMNVWLVLLAAESIGHYNPNIGANALSSFLM